MPPTTQVKGPDEGMRTQCSHSTGWRAGTRTSLCVAQHRTAEHSDTYSLFWVVSPSLVALIKHRTVDLEESAYFHYNAQVTLHLLRGVRILEAGTTVEAVDSCWLAGWPLTAGPAGFL